MNRNRKRLSMVLVLAGITLLVLLSGRIPFWTYDERVLTTDIEQFFSPEHLVRLLPLAVIILAAAAAITGICWIRKRYREQDSMRARYEGMRSSGRAGKRQGRQKVSVFSVIRWSVMVVFSLLIIFGGIFFGFTIFGIDIPVLSCPTNRSQLMESSCYFLAHLPDLFAEYDAVSIALFFGSTILFALLLGRVLCGFLCPMGLVQDLVHLLRQKLKIEGFVMTEADYRKLVPVKWLLVLLMPGAVFAGGNFCDFCPALAVSPVISGLKVSLYFSGFMMILVLVGSFFKRRAWCNICPLGLMIGLFHRLSPFRIKKEPTACTECGACYEACPMGIKMIYTEREKTDVTDWNCIMCGECVKCCPEDHALALAFAGKKIYDASRKRVVSGYQDSEEQADFGRLSGAGAEGAGGDGAGAR